MGIFNRKDEFEFDAYETDKSKTIALIIGVLIVTFIIVLLGLGVYYLINRPPSNQTNNSNQTIFQDNLTRPEPGKVIVDFDGTNITVDESPTGVYYYHTQEVIVGEKCTANNQRVDCVMLTTQYCEDRICRKEIETRTECYVNQKIVECPEGFN